MGEERHSIRPTECSTTSTTTDSCRPFSYALHRHLRIGFLLLVCNPPFLAVIDTLHDLLYVLKSINFWHHEPPFGISTIFTSVVALCFLLPSQASQDAGASSYQKIHFWISSAWNYINGGICSILD